MKLLIKYISLLIFSGLILPVCTHNSIQMATALHKKRVIQPTACQSQKPAASTPFIYPEIVTILFPALNI
jgi:ABC-type sulfate transport system substrate-binding protein